jgi:hypothetical protein
MLPTVLPLDPLLKFHVAALRRWDVEKAEHVRRALSIRR